MRFTFIHAADLHIDSPLAGLGDKDRTVADRFAKAGRKAVQSLVEQTVAERAAFLLIAGDIFDGDWRDYTSGLFFVGALGRLDRAGIPTFIIKGNHDAESVMSRALPYPRSVTVFGSARAETHVVEPCGVAIHGRSFPHRAVPENFVASFPAARPGLLNIGLLHTALDGTRGHAVYAACTADDLRGFGYDYWALGHIHGAAEVSRDPWIVYPGNIQGRSVRETGPKGAIRVTVDDGRIVEVTPIVLDAARWALESIDVSGCEDEEEVLARIEVGLAAAYGAADGRPLAVRLTLRGMTALHARIVARREHLHAAARGHGFSIAGDCWVEQLKVETREAPRRPSQPDGLDVGALLDGAAGSPDFEAALGELIRGVADKLPRELRDEFVADEARLRLQVQTLASDHLLGLLPGTEGGVA